MTRIALCLCLLSSQCASEITAAEESADSPLAALIRTARSGPWSSETTWEGGKIPGSAARVQIREGHTVTYDISSDQVIRSIHVAGTLTFARRQKHAVGRGLDQDSAWRRCQRGRI